MTILVQQLRERALKATPGPWELQTSNSWRRIGNAGARFTDGNVLAPTTHRGDNHPDLAARQEDLDFIVAADPATVLSLLDELDTANANHENAVAHMQSVCAERDRLKAENAELRRILQLAVTLEGPLHAHTRHQIWDGSENRCAWCAVHDEAQEFFSAQRQAMTKEQP